MTEDTATDLYVPKYLRKWKHPKFYFGETWEGWYVFLTTNRDADHITESNWDRVLADIGENPSAAEEKKGLLVVEEHHFLCGWVRWMGIHETDTELLMRCDDILGGLVDGYPVYDDEDLSRRESEEQYETILQMVRDFNNDLYQFEDPDTGEDLVELTDEEIEFITEMECQAACDFHDKPNDEELWADYWKVHGHLMHCAIHGTYVDSEPCDCQMRLPFPK